MSNAVRETPNLPSTQLLDAFRRIWNALVVGTDNDSGLLQMPVLQLRCLRRIAEKDGQRMVDIAQRMQMPLPGVSRLIDRLARRGMVTRHPDPHDRRVVRVALTESARLGLAEIENKRKAKVESCLRHLDDRTIEQMVKSLQQLAAIADQIQVESSQKE